jgi:hypothetical protein
MHAPRLHDRVSLGVARLVRHGLGAVFRRRPHGMAALLAREAGVDVDRVICAGARPDS